MEDELGRGVEISPSSPVLKVSHSYIGVETENVTTALFPSALSVQDFFLIFGQRGGFMLDCR